MQINSQAEQDRRVLCVPLIASDASRSGSHSSGPGLTCPQVAGHFRLLAMGTAHRLVTRDVYITHFSVSLAFSVDFTIGACLANCG